MYLKKIEAKARPVVVRVGREQIAARRVERAAMNAIVDNNLEREVAVEPTFRRDYWTGRYFNFSGDLI